MVRRNVLMVVCLCGCGLVAFACTFMVFNFLRLAQAQTFAQDFVREVVEKGSAITPPDIAPAAASAISHATMTKALDRAKQIGPLVDIDPASCAVQSDVHNICGGQIMVCIVRGSGREGAFEADVAMCRGNDTDRYRLATIHWAFDFAHGEPMDGQDRSHL